MTQANALVLLSPDEMAQADRLAALSRPLYTFMEAAGRAVARAAMREIGPTRTLVLCGPGNNGGDGYVAARLLAEAGWPVRTAALAEPKPDSDAGRAAAAWTGPRVAFSPDEAARADLVIDAIFGAGLSRPLDEAVVRVLAAARRVLAVDVPSGLDGATGQVLGYAPQAELTVTFFRRKPGHLLLPGRELCGRLLLADIGIADAVLDEIGPRTFHNQPGLWRLRTLTASDHKYSRGVVSVCGGAVMPGAARLAAAGARGAGAGLVRLAAEHGAEIYKAGAAGLIVDGEPLASLLGDERRRVWVCGPGLDGDEVRAALPALLAAKREVVADAGALTEAAGEPDRLRGTAVITPHAGEFARLFGAPPRGDRLAAARAAAERTGAVVVLKGSDSIIAAPDGRAAINDNAPPWLGTAGAGDVLCGIIAGLLAGGEAPFEAGCAAVWLHGEAANLAGEGLLAEDLPGLLPEAAKRARARLSPDRRS